MSDLISRQAAIDAIKRAIWDKYTAKDAIDAVCNVPSAQRWIPCKERPPEPDEEVFVYLWGNVPYLARVNGEGQWETEHFYLDADDAPKAWMPLPKPCKGEEDG